MSRLQNLLSGLEQELVDAKQELQSLCNERDENVSRNNVLKHKKSKVSTRSSSLAKVDALLSNIYIPNVHAIPSTKRGKNSAQDLYNDKREALPLFRIPSDSNRHDSCTDQASRKNTLQTVFSAWKLCIMIKIRTSSIKLMAQGFHRKRVCGRVVSTWGLYSRSRRELHDKSVLLQSIQRQKWLEYVVETWLRRCVFSHRYRSLQNRARWRKLQTILVSWAWYSIFRRRYKAYRVMQQRLLCIRGLRYWRKSILLHADYLREMGLATHAFKFFLFRRLKMAIEICRNERNVLEQWISERKQQQLRFIFNAWNTYADGERQVKFAINWSNQHLLARTFDSWIVMILQYRRYHEGRKLVENLYKRNLALRALRYWQRQFEGRIHRQHKLKKILFRLYKRRLWVRWHDYVEHLHYQERMLLLWTAKQRLINWQYRSKSTCRARLYKLKVEKIHSRYLLHTYAWDPWCLEFSRLQRIKYFQSKLKERRLRRIWKTFTLEIQWSLRLTCMVEDFTYYQLRRQICNGINQWRSLSATSRCIANFYQRKAAFHKRARTASCFQTWRTYKLARQEKRKRQQEATNYFVQRSIRCRWIPHLKHENIQLESRRKEVASRYEGRLQSCALQMWRACLEKKITWRLETVILSWKARIRHSRCRHEAIRHLHRALSKHALLLWVQNLSIYRSLEQRAQVVTSKHRYRQLQYFFSHIWSAKCLRYAEARELIVKRRSTKLLLHSLKAWQAQQEESCRLRLALAHHRTRTLQSYFHALEYQTVGVVYIADQRYRTCLIKRSWQALVSHWHIKANQRSAQTHYDTTAAKRSVSKWKIHVTRTLRIRCETYKAISFHQSYQYRAVWDGWLRTITKNKQCSRIQACLTWSTLGRKAFSAWQNAFNVQQKMLSLERKQNEILKRRILKAFIQLTKRRQVAYALWQYTADNVNVSLAFWRWAQAIDTSPRVLCEYEKVTLTTCLQAWQLATWSSLRKRKTAFMHSNKIESNAWQGARAIQDKGCALNEAEDSARSFS